MAKSEESKESYRDNIRRIGSWWKANVTVASLGIVSALITIWVFFVPIHSGFPFSSGDGEGELPTISETSPNEELTSDPLPNLATDEDTEDESYGHPGQDNDSHDSEEARNADTPLNVVVEIGDNAQVGPDTWKAVHNMRVGASVFDQYGAIRSDCYVSLEVTKGGSLVDTGSGSCAASFGLSTREYGTGQITISFDIETEWGATTSAERTINIIEDD